MGELVQSHPSGAASYELILGTVPLQGRVNRMKAWVSRSLSWPFPPTCSLGAEGLPSSQAPAQPSLATAA